jgi:hypothetical protein
LDADPLNLVQGASVFSALRFTRYARLHTMDYICAAIKLPSLVDLSPRETPNEAKTCKFCSMAHDGPQIQRVYVSDMSQEL